MRAAARARDSRPPSGWSGCSPPCLPGAAAPSAGLALLAEPVDPAVDAERLLYRARYAGLLAEVPARRCDGGGEAGTAAVDLIAAALVGGCAEVLVGPLAGAPTESEQTIAAMRQFVLGAVGA